MVVHCNRAFLHVRENMILMEEEMKTRIRLGVLVIAILPLLLGCGEKEVLTPEPSLSMSETFKYESNDVAVEGYVYDYQVSMEPIPVEITALGGEVCGTIHAYPTEIEVGLAQKAIEENPEWQKMNEEKQIKSIGLTYTRTNLTDINGNTIQGQTEIIRNDGSSFAMGAFQLLTDTTDAICSETIEVPDYIKYKLPNLQGSGNMLTLHQAMTKKEELYKLVQQYESAVKSMDRYQLAEKILIEWADCGQVEAGSRGNNINATHMAVIEKFYGKEYMGQNGTNPNAEAGAILEKVYQDLFSQTRHNLILNTSAFSYIFDIKSFLFTKISTKYQKTVDDLEKYDIIIRVQNIA